MARRITPRPSRNVRVMHLGRSFSGHPLEDRCPCQKAQCGLVRDTGIDEDCTQHPMSRARTIRQMHWEEDCPARLNPEPPIKISVV